MVVTLSGDDIDGDNLTFSLGTDAANGSVTVDGSQATYTPSADYNGDDTFTFSVSDGELSATAAVTLTVTAVNDAPVLAAVDTVSFDEDDSLSITLSASDVDGDDLTFSITGGTFITATLDGSCLLYTSPSPRD